MSFLGNEVDHTLLCCQRPDNVRSPVGGVVVHDDHVVVKVRLLCQSALDGIADGACTVAHGDDDRGLHRKVAFVTDAADAFGRDVGLYLFQMFRAGLFHFDLCLAVLRVYIVKVLLSAEAQVVFLLRVEELIQMHDASVPAQEQAQVIQSGKGIVRFRCLVQIFPEQLGADEQQGTHLEIIAHAALLIVVDRVRLKLSVLDFIKIGIEQGGLGIVCHTHHALQSVRLGRYRGCLGIEQTIFGVAFAGYL